MADRTPVQGCTFELGVGEEFGISGDTGMLSLVAVFMRTSQSSLIHAEAEVCVSFFQHVLRGSVGVEMVLRMCPMFRLMAVRA